MAISIYYRIGQLKAETQRFGSHDRVTFVHGMADWDQLIQTETVGKPGSGNLDNEEQWMKTPENEKYEVVTCEPQLVFDQRQKLVTGRPWFRKNSRCSSLTKICFQCRHLSRFETKCDVRCENISIRMFIWSSLIISLFSRFPLLVPFFEGLYHKQEQFQTLPLMESFVPRLKGHGNRK